jgi:hypothetical protein
MPRREMPEGATFSHAFRGFPDLLTRTRDTRKSQNQQSQLKVARSPGEISHGGSLSRQ